jgi:hypothetical protein
LHRLEVDSMVSRLLTKTKYMNGLQCPRLLWIAFNQPGSLPATDIVSQHIFDQGHEVDELGKKLYPNGIDITTDSFTKNIQNTNEHLGKGRPIFQAGFKAADLYSRIDVLLPNGKGDWELVEVKSSTEIKPEHYPDVAFQRYCCQKAGLTITKCLVARVNNKYVRKGDIDPKEFFIFEDVTDAANGAAIGIESAVAEMFQVMAFPECPKCPISAKCRQPYDCPLLDGCYSFLPEHHVLTLYYGKQTGFALLSSGVQHIKDIPPEFRLTPNQKIQRECILGNAPHIDKKAVQAFLGNLRYPIAYFDFETINPAIPLYDGMRPYQKVPFQFSLVVVPNESAEPQQFSFLAKTADDPRPALLAEMKKYIPDSGSIVVYNKGFEGPILKQLGESFPRYREWLDSLAPRLEDLLEPFRKFHYYHPEQKGSVSMKKVLPALTGRSYEGMDINEGEIASVLYWDVTHKPAPEAVRQKVYADLERYCGLDTDGMRSIIEQLKCL